MIFRRLFCTPVLSNDRRTESTRECSLNSKDSTSVSKTIALSFLTGSGLPIDVSSGTISIPLDAPDATVASLRFRSSCNSSMRHAGTPGPLKRIRTSSRFRRPPPPVDTHVHVCNKQKIMIVHTTQTQCRDQEALTDPNNTTEVDARTGTIRTTFRSSIPPGNTSKAPESVARYCWNTFWVSASNALPLDSDPFSKFWTTTDRTNTTARGKENCSCTLFSSSDEGASVENPSRFILLLC